MPTTAELFAHVYAHPADEAPRQVLADRLLEEGDPRGELIALQLRRLHASLPPSGLKREKRLLAEHEAQWLAPIARVLIGHTTEWRGGFLHACGARLDGSTVGAPEWSTVQRLTLYSSERDRPGELAADLRSLRELERANTLALDVLVKSAEKLPLESISYLGPARQVRAWVERQTDTLLKLAELPYLKRLRLAPPTAADLSGKDFGFFFESRLAHRLESLAFTLVRPMAHKRPGPPVDLASFVAPAVGQLNLKRLEVETAGLVVYTLTEGDDGRLSNLELKPLTSAAATGTLLPMMVAPLRGLDPDQLSRLTLRYTGRLPAQRHRYVVEEAARRFKRLRGPAYQPAG